MVFLFWVVFALLKPFEFAEPLSRVESSGQLPGLPLVSLIIPARDEENNLQVCLESIINQDYPNLEVVVIDDRSSDNTSQIAEATGSKFKRFKLISIKEGELSPEWIGKNHALYRGARQASGDWFLFLDADVWFTDKSAVSTAVRQAEENALDLLSLFPRVYYGSFWEKVINPMVGAVFLSVSPIHKINDPNSSVAAAVGAFALVRSESYRKTGGHEAIKREIVEDLYLARLFKNSGCRIKMMDGGDLYQTRMYTSFQEVWQGWSKNLFPSLDFSFRKALGVGVLYFFTNVYPFVIFLFWGGKYLAGGLPVDGFYAIASFIINLVIMQINFSLRLPLDVVPEYAFTMPLGGILILAILANSAVRIGLGLGVSWKGTVYYKN
ncbi:MAG: glycosyltransferase [bacterium]